jgi:hypothetical protein
MVIETGRTVHSRPNMSVSGRNGRPSMCRRGHLPFNGRSIVATCAVSAREATGTTTSNGASMSIDVRRPSTSASTSNGAASRILSRAGMSRPPATTMAPIPARHTRRAGADRTRAPGGFSDRN